MNPRTQSVEARVDAGVTITRLLEPGETLIWSANGRGPHWTLHNLFGLAFIGVMTAVFTIGIVRSANDGETSGWMLFFAGGTSALVMTILTAGLMHAVFSPDFDCYGLTERRVIVVWRYWPGRVRSFTASNIHVLRIRGGKTGDITFWKQSSRYVNRAWAIVGIDDPLATANLIRSTLRLSLPIDDLKRENYIPPIEPRDS